MHIVAYESEEKYAKSVICTCYSAVFYSKRAYMRGVTYRHGRACCHAISYVKYEAEENIYKYICLRHIQGVHGGGMNSARHVMPYAHTNVNQLILRIHHSLAIIGDEETT